MEAKICHFEKFGKCNRQNCQFHHPEEICCDKTCQIQHCLKKHPLDCRYFWVYNACKNENSGNSLQDEANATVWQYCTTMKTQLKEQGEEILKLQSQLLKILDSSNCSNEMDLNDVTMHSEAPY